MSAPTPAASESMSLTTLVALGFAGGVVSGLFGVGGGIVFVPLMVLVLKFTQRRAHATSLLAIVPTAIVGAISFGIAGEVSWATAVLIAASASLGSRVGARWLRQIDERRLRLVFLCLLLAVGIRFAIEAAGGTENVDGAIQLGTGGELALRAAAMLVIGTVVGALAALLGVGGGIVIVPILVGLFGAGQIEAQATSLAAMIVPSSAAVYWHSRSGLVEWAAGMRLGVGGAFGAIAGSRIALLLMERVVEIGFGILLLFIIARMGRMVLTPSPPPRDVA